MFGFERLLQCRQCRNLQTDEASRRLSPLSCLAEGQVGGPSWSMVRGGVGSIKAEGWGGATLASPKMQSKTGVVRDQCYSGPCTYKCR